MIIERNRYTAHPIRDAVISRLEKFRLTATAVDAYFPIVDVGNDASAEQISNGLWWALPHLQRLKDQAPGKPLFITELGLVSQRSETSHLEKPWTTADSQGPVDLDLQARLVTGACQFYSQAQDLNGNQLVNGLAWWMTGIYPLEHPETDTGFDLMGKPAQHAIADCYNQR